jgi:hypothetical protein
MTRASREQLTRAATQWLQWEMDCGAGPRLGLFTREELDAIAPARALALVDQHFPGGLAEFARNPRRSQHATRGMEMVAGLAVWLHHDGLRVGEIAEQFNVPAHQVVWWLLADRAAYLQPTRLWSLAGRHGAHRAHEKGLLA